MSNKATQFKPGIGGRGTKPKGPSVKSVLFNAMRKGLTQPKNGKTIPWGQELTEQIIQTAATVPNSYERRAMVDYILKTATPDEVDGRLDRFMARNVAFLEYRIYSELIDIQQTIFASNNRKIRLMAGRRAGKTKLMQARCKKQLVHGGLYLYIGLTSQRAIALMYDDVLNSLEALGLSISNKNRTDGVIKTSNGGEAHFKGNSTADEREKLRGGKWDEIDIDECQSQKALSYLINDICEPMLLDRQGCLVLGGTGPRVRGTYWEMLWTDGSTALKVSWNLTQNPHIPDAENVLAGIRSEKNLKDTDPLYVREYLGQIAYDDDALVLRMTDANKYTESDFTTWLSKQVVTDVQFIGGLDFGSADADAYVQLCFARGKREIWVLSVYKKRREGTAELADAIRAGMADIAKRFPQYQHNKMRIFGDCTNPKAIQDLSTAYNLPVEKAYNQDKDFGIELMQEDVRGGYLKTTGNTDLDDEALKTVFARDEQDNLTRIIDDETYHPDAFFATLYGCRYIWLVMGREKRSQGV
jgi:hypothetical protein